MDILGIVLKRVCDETCPCSIDIADTFFVFDGSFCFSFADAEVLVGKDLVERGVYDG